MRFGLSEDQTLLDATVRRLLADQAPLDAVRAYADGSDDHALWATLCELGLGGLLVPEAAGGLGLGVLDAAVIAEALGYHVTPAPFLGTAVLFPRAVAAAGLSDELLWQERLGAVVEGSLRVGVAFPQAGGQRGRDSVTVRGERLNGTVTLVLDDAAEAYLVASDDGALWWIETSASGCVREAFETVDRSRRCCRLTLTDCAATLLTQDPSVLAQLRAVAWVILAADSLGAGRAMLEKAVAYAGEREQFNRPIATFQAVKHMCAEMAAELEPCTALVWYAAHCQDHIRDEALTTAGHAKALLGDVGQFVAKTATEVHGGMGFTDLVGLHYWFKRIGFDRQAFGNPQRVRAELAELQGW
ncbi:MAG: acyl-CoA dehydrogenase [Gammaproteobacteria bacterium]|nr:acyl-CoA dehydrogenase [Gammaproteobacteria bacterium]